jgi:hypothetical protein
MICHLFMHHLPALCLLQWEDILNLLPTYSQVDFFFLTIAILDTSTLSAICFANTFFLSMVCLLFFKIVSNFWWSLVNQLFSFPELWFWIILKQSFPNPCHKAFVLHFTAGNHGTFFLGLPSGLNRLTC